MIALPTRPTLPRRHYAEALWTRRIQDWVGLTTVLTRWSAIAAAL